MNLRTATIRLAYENPELRPYLLPLIAEDEGDEGSSSSSGVSGDMVEFMKEFGDKIIRNPDTGNYVKVKSLKGDKGKRYVKEQFLKWKEKRDKKEKKG